MCGRCYVNYGRDQGPGNSDSPARGLNGFLMEPVAYLLPLALIGELERASHNEWSGVCIS